MRREREKKLGVTPALWLPVLWYALASSRSVGQWIYDLTGIGMINHVEGSPINRVVYGSLISAGLLVLLFRKVNWSRMLKVNRWMFLLLFYTALSILWSEFQGVSIAKWIYMIGYVVMALVVLTEHNPVEAISALFRRCLYVFLPLSIVLISYFPEIGVRKEMWLGATTHKNSLGSVAMIGAIYFLWKIAMRDGKRDIATNLVFLSMALLLLVGSDSMTSVFVFVIGVLTLLIIRLFRDSTMSIGKQAIAGAFVIAIFLLMFNLAVEALSQKNLLSITLDLSGRDMTFTGRKFIWANLLDIASRSPIVGCGYASFWVGDLSQDMMDLWEKLKFGVAQAHNGYIDVYLDLGLIGLALLASVVVSALRDSFKILEVYYEYGILKTLFLCMVLTANITESVFLRASSHLWFVFLLVAIRPADALNDVHESDSR